MNIIMTFLLPICLVQKLPTLGQTCFIYSFTHVPTWQIILKKIQREWHQQNSRIEAFSHDIFTLPVSLFPKSGERDLLGLHFLSQRKARAYEWAQILQLCERLTKRTTSFSPHLEYWGVLHNCGGRMGWEDSNEGPQKEQRDTDCPEHFMKSIRKSATGLPGMPQWWFPNWHKSTPHSMCPILTH